MSSASFSEGWSASGGESTASDGYLCDYERERLQNIKENQQMLKRLGLPVTVEGSDGKGKRAGRRKVRRTRSQRQRRRVAYCSPSEDSSDSDQEWEPWMSQQETCRKTKGKGEVELPPLDLATRLELLRAVDEEVDECLLQAMEAKKSAKSAKHGSMKCYQSSHSISHSDMLDDYHTLPDQFNTTSEEEEFWGFSRDTALPSNCTIQYTLQDSLFNCADCEEDFQGFTRHEVAHTTLPSGREQVPRKAKQVEYKENAVSDEDEYLFCDDCNSLYHGDCPVHGPLKELGSAGYDTSSLTYTQLPVPAQLTVRPSSIPNAGLGIFASQFIPRGVRLGPYEGRRVGKLDMGDIKDTQYVWEIRKEGEMPYFIDGHDPTHANWMRFVNCARSEDEQNLLAFQFHGDIYYRTFKNVYPGTELLVWYGDEYARELGIEVNSNDLPANYECLECGASFIEKSSFDIHLKHNQACAETNPQTHTCGICQQAFSKLQQLQEHVRKHGDRILGTAAGDKPYKCEHCGKCFSQGGDLRKHLRTHTGDKPYKCEHCGKCFSEGSSLRKHLRTHTGDKPYKCEHCGKCFSEGGSLRTHLRTHTGDKPYKCEHCGKCFSVGSSLRKHLRTHTGDKPYKCEYCGKCFSQGGSLRTHLRTHTGDKPYKCEHCGKCFSQGGDLRKHLRTHTGDKPYKCEHCGKCFSQGSNLCTHLRTHTGTSHTSVSTVESAFVRVATYAPTFGLMLKTYYDH